MSKTGDRARGGAGPHALVDALAQVPESPVPASRLARICGVDTKTVHHWVEAGLIPHFRTPGRHLRFRSRDVVAFLRSAGHPAVAEAATPTPLVLGARRDDSQPGRFVDDPYRMLVEATRAGGNPLVVDWSYLDGVEPRSYLDALAAAVPDAPLVVVGNVDSLRPGVLRATSVDDALAGLVE